MEKLKLANALRNTARWAMLVFGILIFIFALVSGSSFYNAGLMGIVYNSPNAIPWAFLLGLVYLAWKNELWGGTLITLMGIFTIFFFKTYEDLIVFSIVSLPLLVFGCFFLASWYLRKN